MPKELTAAVEGWASHQPDSPARSEAFRRLVEMGLATSALTRPHSAKTRANAADLAGQEIERLVDQSLPQEERASRKRRLLKGPSEFRNMRRDHPPSRRKP